MLFVVFIFLLLLSVYYKLYLPTQFWKRKGIPHVTPHMVFGNLTPVVFGRKTLNTLIEEFYSHFKSHRYYGVYQFLSPTLIISDLELIKEIYVKNFDSFMNRPDLIPKTADPFWKKALMNRDGKDWQEMRRLLRPAFTGQALKAMFPLMNEYSEKFVNHFTNETGTVTVELRNLFTRCTNDITASCLYGIECDSLKDKDNEFFRMSKEANDFTGLKSVRFFASKLNHTLVKILGITFFSNKVRRFFERITKETIEYRERTGLVRPDIIHFLKAAQRGRLNYEKHDGNENEKFDVIQESDVIESDNFSQKCITDEDIAIQVLTFFFGGYDPVSTVLCHTSYELAVNPDVQEKLTKEINSTLESCNSKLTYDALMRMKYLDTVISESLRLWPPGTSLFRLCVKPFVIEPTLPHEKPFTVEPGTEIYLPSCAIHRNPKYFRNPHKFDPDRFSDKSQDIINTYTFHPFGIGPRHCIGYKFALMEIKTILFSLLSQFQIVPVKETVIPFRQAKYTIPLRSAHGYWFGLKRRTNQVFSKNNCEHTKI